MNRRIALIVLALLTPLPVRSEPHTCAVTGPAEHLLAEIRLQLRPDDKTDWRDTPWSGPLLPGHHARLLVATNQPLYISLWSGTLDRPRPPTRIWPDRLAAHPIGAGEYATLPTGGQHLVLDLTDARDGWTLLFSRGPQQPAPFVPRVRVRAAVAGAAPAAACVAAAFERDAVPVPLPRPGDGKP